MSIPMATGCANASREPHVVRAMGNLRGYVENFETTVEILETRLLKVLREEGKIPENGSGEVKERDEIRYTPLASEVMTLSDRVRTATNRLDALLHRLEV